MRRDMIVAQDTVECKELSLSKKVSGSSDYYAMRKLERDVLEIYAALGKSEEEGLAHDEFGALMAELGFLRFVDAVDSQNARSEAKEAASALNVSNAPVSSKESTVTSASTISRLAQFANSMAEGRARVPQGLPPAPPPPSSSGGNQTRPLQTPRQPAPGHPAGGGIKAEAIGVRSSAKALQHVHLRDEMDLVERVWFALVYPDEGRLTASTFLRFLRRALIGTSAASEHFKRADGGRVGGGRELQSPKEPGYLVLHIVCILRDRQRRQLRRRARHFCGRGPDDELEHDRQGEALSKERGGGDDAALPRVCAHVQIDASIQADA